MTGKKRLLANMATIGLFAFGALVVYFGSALLYAQLSFDRISEPAQGRVVEHRSTTLLDKWKRPYEQLSDVYAFTTSTGTVVRFEDVPYLHSLRSAIGKRAAVRYPPERPERAQLAGALWLPGGVTLSLGIACWTFAALRLRRSRAPAPSGSPKNKSKAERRRQRSTR